ncbi:hypothetical protein EI94DRAFT_1741793 [Lactarius quietus]|nr:hypothetical protein EI94DRAFT_1741793 [Lactarius quietus]
MIQGTHWGSRPEWSWTQGESVKQFDVDCFGLAKTVEALTQCFTFETALEITYIFSPSSSALQAVINPQSKSVQQAVLLFHFSLTSFTTAHPLSRIILVWTPQDYTLERQTMAWALVKAACCLTPPEGLNQIQLAAYQKDRARIKAFEAWARDWQKDHTIRESGNKPQSFAYSHALTRPLDGNNHPLWQAAMDHKKDNKGRKKYTYSRRTTSTALQVAVDHAFTRTYVTCFCPSDPPEAPASKINFFGQLVPFCKILGPNKKNTMHLLTFIQESSAFTCPEACTRRADREPD